MTEFVVNPGGEKALPLQGLQLLEVGCGLAGAFCGRVMAALGASVRKLEPPEGDSARREHIGNPDRSMTSAPSLFDFLNAGKKSVSLAVGTPTGNRQLALLAGASDVIIYSENSGPSNLSIIHELKGHLSPEAVLGIIEPFGGTGPYAAYQAVPMTYQALGGYMYIMGEPDREPLALPGQHPYYLAGLYALAGCLTARHAKLLQGTAFSPQVMVSIHEVIPTLSQYTISLYTYEGRIRSRHGNRWQDIHPLTMYRCADGWYLLALPWEHFWERFCIMIDRPELITDPRFASVSSRFEHAEEVDAALSEWFASKRRDEVTSAMHELRLPLGPYLDLHDVLANDQLHARAYFEHTDEEAGELLVPGLPFSREGLPWSIGSVPGLGEHTDEVLDSIARRARKLEETRAIAWGDKQAPELSPSPPLTRLRVLDLTWVWSGPLAARILADLGAEVIKVEMPSRAVRPSAAWSIGAFHKLNRNKKSIALDLAQREPASIFESLVSISDVVIDNFSARVMPNLGFDYTRLASLNPRIIAVSMPAFGTAGPYQDDVCMGASLEAMTGLPSLLGYGDGQPYASSFAYPDPVASLWAVCGVLTALEQRRRTGRGCFVDLSQLEGTVTLLGEYLIELQRTGFEPRRRGNRHPECVPHGCYPCAGSDRWITIAVRSNEEWARLVQIMGQPRWAQDERFRDVKGRRRFEDELDAYLKTWTTQWHSDELMARLQAAGIPAGYVADARDLLVDPQLEANGFFIRLNQPEVGEKPFPGLPIRIDGVARGTGKPCPELGQDTQWVLEEILQVPQSEAKALVRRLHGNFDRPLGLAQI